MTTPLVLFLALTACTVLLCLWAGFSALLRNGDVGVLHRCCTITAACLAPSAALALTFYPERDSGCMVATAAALPVLAVLAAWCNITTLQGQGFLVKGLHLPLFLFNALLAGIYGVRFVQDQWGFDLGAWGTAITAGHALLQASIGSPDAASNPTWYYVPFLLPVTQPYRWPHALGLLCCSMIATALLAVLVMIMPFAFTRAHSFRDVANEPVRSLPADMTIGVSVPWAIEQPEAELDPYTDELRGLGAHSVTLDIVPEAVAQPKQIELAAERIARLRADGRQVTVVVRPSRWMIFVDMRQLTLAMAKAQWLAAEKLDPDLLVLYAGPFGRLGEQSLKIGTVDEWIEAITRAAGEVHQANPRVRVAVSLESRGPHSEELFRRLRADDSPVDVVGIELNTGRGKFAEALGRLATLERWLKEVPGTRPVQILEVGACPYTTGGELGQWHFLEAVLLFASKHGLTGVAIDGLIDGPTATGLLARDGRPRRAYFELQRLLRGNAVAAPR